MPKRMPLRKAEGRSLPVQLLGGCELLYRETRLARQKVFDRQIKSWWSWPGLNRRPRECHSRALPTAPQPHTIHLLGHGGNRLNGIESTM